MPPSFTPVEEAPRAERYTLYDEIARGGMATVYFAKLSGAVGFSRVVAVKRMQRHLVGDSNFVAMFVDEAMLASRVKHPNVVPILDVGADRGEIFIVMDYVRGQSLSALLAAAVNAAEPVPVPIASGIMCQVLAGLHAAHEARDRRGHLLGLVHRDVSPHNILVGADGVARIMDFGVAKAESRLGVTHDGQLKGKLCYMAPEQIRREGDLDRTADVFASAVVLWNMLAGRLLFRGNDLTEVVASIVDAEIPPLASFRSDVPPALEAVLHEALQRDRRQRPPTAEAFATRIEGAVHPVQGRVVGEWVLRHAADIIARRDAYVALIEDTTTAGGAAAAPPSHDAAALAAASTGLREHQDPSLSSAPTLERVPSSPERGEHDAPTVVEGPAFASTALTRRRLAIAFALTLLAAGGSALLFMALAGDRSAPLEPRISSGAAGPPASETVPGSQASNAEGPSASAQATATAVSDDGPPPASKSPRPSAAPVPRPARTSTAVRGPAPTPRAGESARVGHIPNDP